MLPPALLDRYRTLSWVLRSTASQLLNRSPETEAIPMAPVTTGVSAASRLADVVLCYATHASAVRGRAPVSPLA